ncbi:MAG TPA: hypothetical protein VGM10_29140 [Actinocrinis sp.]|jgi:hypothetical protein
MPSDLIAGQTDQPAATADARAQLRAWVLEKAGGLDPAGLTDQTPLLERRILRSVHLPELILLLERLGGGEIDVEDISPGQFRDIDTMMANFVRPADGSEPRP